MRVSEVCHILAGKLPQFTDTFSEHIFESSISILDGVITVTTSTVNTLDVGDKIVLSGFDVEANFPMIDSDYINTIHTVASIISTTQYTLGIVPLYISGTSSTNGKTHSQVGVLVGLDANLVIDSYVNLGTKTNLCYVVDDGMIVSRDRKSQGDAIQTSTRNQDYRMIQINNFTVIVFLSFQNDTIGSLVSDALRQILTFMIKSLSGVALSTDWSNSSYGVSLVGMQPLSITNSYVAQAYTFEVSEQTVSCDGNVDTQSTEIQEITMGAIIPAFL
jgi:hypothetical protein